MVAAVGAFHAQGPVNLYTCANAGIPLLRWGALDPEIAGGNAEGVPQEVLLSLLWSHILPTHLLQVASGT